MIRKTPLMLEVERKHGNQPLELLLPRLYNEMGLPRMAADFGIGKGTIWYWFLKFGINVRRIAVAPSQDIVVTKGRNGKYPPPPIGGGT